MTLQLLGLVMLLTCSGAGTYRLLRVVARAALEPEAKKAADAAAAAMAKSRTRKGRSTYGRLGDAMSDGSCARRARHAALVSGGRTLLHTATKPSPRPHAVLQHVRMQGAATRRGFSHSVSIFALRER